NPCEIEEIAVVEADAELPVAILDLKLACRDEAAMGGERLVFRPDELERLAGPVERLETPAGLDHFHLLHIRRVPPDDGPAAAKRGFRLEGTRFHGENIMRTIARRKSEGVDVQRL